MMITTGPKKRILYSLVSLSASNYQHHTPSFFGRRTCRGPAFWRLLFHRIRCAIPHVFLCPFSGRSGLVCGKFFGHKHSVVLHLAALMGLGLLHSGSRAWELDVAFGLFGRTTTLMDRRGGGTWAVQYSSVCCKLLRTKEISE